MTTTPQPLRMAKSRQRARVLLEAQVRGFDVLDRPDELMRDSHGVLWAWHFDPAKRHGKWIRFN